MLSQAPPSAVEAESSPDEIMVSASLLKALLFQCHTAKTAAECAMRQINELLRPPADQEETPSPEQ